MHLVYDHYDTTYSPDMKLTLVALERVNSPNNQNVIQKKYMLGRIELKNVNTI